jgi:hypothetical protein
MAKDPYMEVSYRMRAIGQLQTLKLARQTNFRHSDHVEPVLDRYRNCLMRSWRAKAVGMFIAASAAAISTSAWRA